VLRRDIDDPATNIVDGWLANHLHDGTFRTIEEAGEVDRNHPVPLFDRGLKQIG
jgi:hypothetical protein